MIETPLVPPPAVATARANGRIPFGFGSRFFVALLLGLGWLVPAWWISRFIVAMFLWDGLLLAAWFWDLQELPRASQLGVRRIWRLRPALAVPASVTIELRNAGKSAIHARIVDETPLQLRLEPPTLEIFVRGNRTAAAEYPILPGERGDVRLGRTFLRYQSPMHLAERWAVAETSQAVCVLPNIEEAEKHTLYLIRSRQVEIEKRRRHQRGLGREFDSMRGISRGRRNSRHLLDSDRAAQSSGHSRFSDRAQPGGVARPRRGPAVARESAGTGPRFAALEARLRR